MILPRIQSALGRTRAGSGRRATVGHRRGRRRLRGFERLGRRAVLLGFAPCAVLAIALAALPTRVYAGFVLDPGDNIQDVIDNQAEVVERIYHKPS